MKARRISDDAIHGERVGDREICYYLVCVERNLHMWQEVVVAEFDGPVAYSTYKVCGFSNPSPCDCPKGTWRELGSSEVKMLARDLLSTFAESAGKGRATTP
jgi:hypothetical protein